MCLVLDRAFLFSLCGRGLILELLTNSRARRRIFNNHVKRRRSLHRMRPSSGPRHADISFTICLISLSGRCRGSPVSGSMLSRGPNGILEVLNGTKGILPNAPLYRKEPPPSSLTSLEQKGALRCSCHAKEFAKYRDAGEISGTKIDAAPGARTQRRLPSSLAIISWTLLDVRHNHCSIKPPRSEKRTRRSSPARRIPP